jgi:hypothetical protein
MLLHLISATTHVLASTVIVGLLARAGTLIERRHRTIGLGSM